MFNANVLKRYYDRANANTEQGILNVVGVAIIEDDEHESVSGLNLNGILEYEIGKTGVSMGPDLT